MYKTLSIKHFGFAALALTIGAMAMAPGAAEAKRHRYMDYIDAHIARDIAFDTGIVEIKKMELDDGVWEIKGWDDRNQKIELELDARSGGIVKIERD